MSNKQSVAKKIPKANANAYLAISNKFATAKNHKLLSREAQKLEAWLLSQIRPRDQGFDTYKITASQIVDLFGIRKDYAYKKLNRVSDELLTHIIYIKDGKLERKYGLISSATYHTGEGWCEMSIHPDLEPHLLNLRTKGNFAILELLVSWSFTGIYSYPLYKYLKAFLHKDSDRFDISISVDELKKVLGCFEKYANFSNFCQRVLNPVKEEFIEKADINFNFEVAGRKKKKVISLDIFIFRQEKLPKKLQELSDISDKGDLNSLDPIDIKHTSIDKDSLEVKLNELGWIGKFDKLLKEVKYEVIDFYFDNLKEELAKLESTEINSTQVSEYITGSIKSQAQRYYELFNKPKPPVTNLKESGKKIEYTSIEKKLYKLGFVGDVRGYIKKEGEQFIKEVLNSTKLKNQFGENIPIGILREHVTSLRIKKDIESQDGYQEKKIEKNLLKDKLAKYKKLGVDFTVEFNEFIKHPNNCSEGDQSLLKKHETKPIDKVPDYILEEFFKWRVC